MIKICQKCGANFKTFPSRVGRYCSYQCSASGTKNSPFVKGHKDMVPSEARKRQGIKMRQYKGEKCWNWKSEVTKRALHNWVDRELGKARSKPCQFCGNPARDWASRTHKYERSLEEFMALCRKCHIIYDFQRAFRSNK